MAQEKNLGHTCQSHQFVSSLLVPFGGFTATLACGGCGRPISERFVSGAEFQTAALSDRLVRCPHCQAFARIEPPPPKSSK